MDTSLSMRVSKLMKQEGYSQKELAQLVGVTEAAMSRYLSGDREPKIEVVANLATALHTTSDYLIYGRSDKDDLSEIYRLVARGVRDMTTDEKMRLVRLILKDE